MPAIVEHQNTVKAKYAGLSRTVIRGIILVVALSAYVASIASFLYRRTWEMHMLAFAVANLVLIALVPETETLPAIEGEGAATRKRLRLLGLVPPKLLSHCGMGENWVCAF